MLMPSLAASACASALPPGGQSVTGALPSAIAAAAARAAGEAALAAVRARHQGLDLGDDGSPST
jgi:hypothetical protein